jgi:hypothetical protein
MADRNDRWPDLPYLGQRGCSPRCGEQLRPDVSEVVVGGSWSKGDERWGVVTGGHLFSCKCPGCGASLLSCPDGWPRWQEVDPTQVSWFVEPSI